MVDERQPAQAFPPSVFILEEMKERGWSGSYLADVARIHPATLYEILYSNRQITQCIADALGEAFGVSAQFFLNLEEAYQESKANEF